MLPWQPDFQSNYPIKLKQPKFPLPDELYMKFVHNRSTDIRDKLLLWICELTTDHCQYLNPSWAFSSGPEVMKLFSCSTLLSTKFILLINVKMPTIVGILRFISMINTTPERLKARNFFICRYFSFYEQLKFHAQLSWAWKKFYNLEARWL